MWPAEWENSHARGDFTDLPGAEPYLILQNRAGRRPNQQRLRSQDANEFGPEEVGMGDGRSSERFSDSDKVDLGYGDIAPKLGQEVYERTQGTGQPPTDWRGGYRGGAAALGHAAHPADQRSPNPSRNTQSRGA